MVLHGHSDLGLHWHGHPCTTSCVMVLRYLQYPRGAKGGVSDIRRCVSDGAIQGAHPKGMLCHLPLCQVCIRTHTHTLPAWQPSSCIPIVSTAQLSAFSSSFRQLPEKLLLCCPWWPELTFGKHSPAILQEGTLKSRS